MGYRFLSKLGAGGMGDVYVALQEELDRKVALKKLPKSDEELEARFRREVKLISQLDHPNIVRVFDWGELDGHPFYTMELVEGATLAREPAGDFARACELMEQAADAVAYLHERGLVHRDIKPANFVVAGSRLILIDFGLARSKENTVLTAAGAVLGTLRYLSPEAAQGKPAEEPADVYALACTAHELISGEPAVGGAAFPQILAGILSATRPALPGAAGVPEWFLELQARALALDPRERPTAPQYRDALRAHAAPKMKSMRVPAIVPRSRPAVRPVDPTPVPGSVRRRMPGARVVAGVLLGLVVGLAIGARATRPAAVGAPAAADDAERDRELLIRSLVVRITESSAWVSFRTTRLLEFDTEVRVPGGAAVKRLRRGAVGLALVHVEGLVPGTPYVLRIARADGAVLLPDARFRTRPKDHGDDVRRQLAALREPRSVDGALEFFKAYPDPRATQALGGMLEAPHLGGARVDDIALLAELLPDPGLAHDLWEKRQREIANPRTRGRVLLAAVTGGNALLSARAVSEIEDATDPVLVEAGVRAAEEMGPQMWPYVHRAMAQGRAGPDIGTRMARMAPGGIVPATDRTGPTSEKMLHVIHDAFIEVGSDAAVERLIERRSARHWDRDYTDDALAMIGTPAARAALVPSLEGNHSPEDKLAAMAALQRCGPPAYGSVPEPRFIEHPELAISREAIAYFGSWGGPDAIPPLRRMTRAPDAERAGLAAWALARIGTDPAVSPLARAELIPEVRALAASDRDASGLGAWALARLAGDGAAVELRTLLHGEPAEMRLHGLAWAIAACGDRGLAPELRGIAGRRKLSKAVKDALDAAAARLETPPPAGALTLVVPAGVRAVRVPLARRPGDSVELCSAGAWGVAGQQPVSVLAELAMPGLAQPLSLTVLVPHYAARAFEGPGSVFAFRRGELALSSLTGMPRAAWLAKRPEMRGFAVATLVP